MKSRDRNSRTLSILAATLAIVLTTTLGACATKPKPEPTPEPAPAPAPEPEPPKATLSDLITSGDRDGIRTFFANQEQLNAPDSQGSYPLHRSVEKGSAEMVELLLILGARVDSLDANGRTPLRLAVERGATPCAKVLAERGADIFAADKSGITAAEAAIAKGGEMIASVFTPKTVANKGADGKTALHIACDRLLEDAVSRILAVGADPNVRDKDGRSPLDLTLLHPDRIEAARIAETLVLKGSGPSFPDFTWFYQAARAVDYNSVRYVNGNTPLHEATERRQKGFLEFLVSRKVNPNVRNTDESAPLHEAVRSGWLEGAEILLVKGKADPNVRDGFDNTPLHIALPEEGRSEGITLLLKYGADVSLKDRNGNTPLHVAVQIGYPVPMIQSLLDKKAPVNAANAAGDTALMLAIRAARYDYAKSLLDAGADIFLVNGRGESPLSVAVSTGPEALDAIVTKANVSSRDNFGNAPLAIAVGLAASPESVALLVSKGADVNARNNAGDTALHLAVRQNLKSQGEALLLAKADVFTANVRGESPLILALTAKPGPVEWLFTPETLSGRDSSGDSCLHHAAKRNLALAVEFLLEKGALADAVNGAGETALHAGVKADSAEAVKTLLVLGSSLSARDAMGDTALHVSVLWSARKSLPLLVLAGAELDARDFAGEAPIHQCIRKRDRESLKYLLERGADADAMDNRGAGPLASAVKSGLVDFARDLLAAGADPNARDLGGRTALHEAVDSSDIELTRLLVGAGGDIMGRDGDGQSPISLALRRGLGVVKIVVLPANVNVPDAEGKTPLRLAVEARAPAESIAYMIATGAKVDIRDRFSATALHAALRQGDLESATLLARAGADPFARDRDGDTPASIAIAKGGETLKSLVAASGAAARDKLGNGYLHYAAIAGNVDAAKALMTAGADRAARNIAGETASEVARKRGKNDLAELLK